MSVDIFRAEQLVSGIADIVGFENYPSGKFVLNTEIVVVHIRIADSLWENDSRQDRSIGTKWCPAGKVSGGLSSDALTRVRGRTTESGRSRWVWRATGRGANRRTVDKGVHISVQKVIHKVERVIREIPARVRQRVVERALVGNSKSAAERSLAIAEHIVSEPNSRTDIIVVALPQRLCGSKAARTANSLELCDLCDLLICETARTVDDAIGIDHAFEKSGPWSRNECSSQIVLFVVTSEQVIANPKVQRQSLGDLPVILEIGAELQVASMPDVFC